MTAEYTPAAKRSPFVVTRPSALNERLPACSSSSRIGLKSPRCACRRGLLSEVRRITVDEAHATVRNCPSLQTLCLSYLICSLRSGEEMFVRCTLDDVS
jgi:hypothetical protein